MNYFKHLDCLNTYFDQVMVEMLTFCTETLIDSLVLGNNFKLLRMIVSIATGKTDQNNFQIIVQNIRLQFTFSFSVLDACSTWRAMTYQRKLMKPKFRNNYISTNLSYTRLLLVNYLHVIRNIKKYSYQANLK